MTKKTQAPPDSDPVPVPDPVPDPGVVEEVIQDTTEAIQESAAVVEETIEPQPAAVNPVTRGLDQLFERLDLIDQRLDQIMKPRSEPIVNTQEEKKEVKENAPQETNKRTRSKRINIFKRSQS